MMGRAVFGAEKGDWWGSFWATDGTGYGHGLEEKLKGKLEEEQGSLLEWSELQTSRGMFGLLVLVSFFWKKKLAGKEGEAKGGCFVNSQIALGLGTSLFLNILSHSLLIHEHGFGYLPWTSRATGLFWLNMFIHIWCSALSISYSWSFLL